MIYSDGSKMASGVGSAFVVVQGGEVTYSVGYSLNDYCSIYQAEMWAIIKALEWAKNCPEETIIATDSQSVLQMCVSYRPKCQLSLQLFNALSSAQQTSVTWVPGHANVAGNEAADFLAKSSIVSGFQVWLPVPQGYIREVTAKSAHSSWSQWWELATMNDTTRAFFPRLFNFKGVWSTTVNTELVQFITTHGKFQQYLHWMKIKPTNKCSCKTAAETVQHIIFECPLRNIFRTKLINHFKPWPPTLADFMKSPYKIKLLATFAYNALKN